MGYLSDTYANTVLESVFNSTVYIALSTTAPTNTGTNVSEPGSGIGYARAAANPGVWGTPSGRTKTNVLPILFPESTSGWGTVTHFAIYSAATAGTFLAWGALTAPRTINTGVSPTFAQGALTVTLPGS